MKKPGMRVKYRGSTGTVVASDQIPDDHIYWGKEKQNYGPDMFVLVDNGKWLDDWAKDHEPYFHSAWVWEPLLGEEQEETPSQNLKILNSDGRTSCAKCNGVLKEPYPGIRYCPICEG